MSEKLSDDLQTGEKLLSFVLNRFQTRNYVENAILQAVTVLTEKRHLINDVHIYIEGFDDTRLHPALIEPAKHKYAEAIEWGLSGFLVSNGFIQTTREVYFTAYASAQIKGDKIYYEKINNKHMRETIFRSFQVYLELIERATIQNIIN